MRYLKPLFLLLLTAIFMLSCSLLAPSADPTPLPVANFILGLDSSIPPTKTPYQPVPPTLAPTATATPIIIPTPKPTQKPTPTRGPRPKLELPPNQLNVLLLGSDRRPSGGFRTDVMVLVTLHPASRTVSLLSFPRDLYVFIPGVGMQRINVAQAYGGFALTQATFEYNFGIHVDHYMLTNFNGFKEIFEAVDYIYVDVEKELYDKCDLRWSSGGYCRVTPGTVKMDGDTALWYVRSRYSSSDLDRTRRAQEVLIGLFKRLMDLDALNRIDTYGQILYQNVETDMSLDTLFSFLSVAPDILADPTRIRRYAIGAGQVYNYIVPENGAMVLVPIQDAAMQVIRQALSD